MSPNQKQTIRALALEGEDTASRAITGMLRLLAATNEREPLPAGFLDHQEDLKSARATIERVCAAMREATRGTPVPV